MKAKSLRNQEKEDLRHRSGPLVTLRAKERIKEWCKGQAEVKNQLCGDLCCKAGVTECFRRTAPYSFGNVYCRC